MSLHRVISFQGSSLARKLIEGKGLQVLVFIHLQKGMANITSRGSSEDSWGTHSTVTTTQADTS